MVFNLVHLDLMEYITESARKREDRTERRDKKNVEERGMWDSLRVLGQTFDIISAVVMMSF